MIFPLKAEFTVDFPIRSHDCSIKTPLIMIFQPSLTAVSPVLGLVDSMLYSMDKAPPATLGMVWDGNTVLPDIEIPHVSLLKN